MKRWIHAKEDDFNLHDTYGSDVTDMWFVKSDDGVSNCCISVAGYDKPMRGRSSMICLKEEDGNLYVVTKANEDDYGVPGGGWDRDELPIDSALRELHEEVQLDATDVKRFGTLIEYHDEVKDWVRDHVEDPDDWWYGYYSAIFVGMYSGKFIGHIDEEDKESGYHWERFSDVADLLPGEYVDAIESYLGEAS